MPMPSPLSELTYVKPPLHSVEKFKVFFGAEVKETHDLLLNRGLRDPTLDELYLNPATTHGMRVVADRF